ncbi:hypothetical protein BLOT_001208 [Blomia tropicalis]|nr:hypothetical protein BLOT_001208 [Blomia tropicalis]
MVKKLNKLWSKFILFSLTIMDIEVNFYFTVLSSMTLDLDRISLLLKISGKVDKNIISNGKKSLSSGNCLKPIAIYKIEDFNLEWVATVEEQIIDKTRSSLEWS